MIYFQAFRPDIQSDMPPTLLFTVESLVSQMLATADLGFLHAALQQHCLARAFFEELDFLGQVPKDYLPKALAYLNAQEPALSAVVERLAKEPDNETFRAQLCQPASSPNSSH